MISIKFALKNLYKIILLLNLLLFSRLFAICFEIKEFNYLVIILLYLMTLALYWFYNVILKKVTLKVLFTVSILIVLWILNFFKVVNIYALLYNDFISLRNVYLGSLSINFSMCLPFLIIIIPVAISIVLSFKTRVPCITLIITLPIMYLFWYYGCSDKLYTSIYIILGCFDLGLNIHSSSIKKAENNNYKFLIPTNNNRIYIAIMVALTISFAAFAVETFGVKSIKEFKNDKIATKINDADSIGNRYGLSYSGYGDNSSKLGGPIKINYNLILKVKSNKPMYLRGSVLDYYTGFGWSRDSENYYVFNNVSNSKVLDSEKIEISPQILTTSTFLAPLNTFNVVSQGDIIMSDNSNLFIIGDKSSVTLPYTVEYSLSENEKFDDDDSYTKEVNEKYNKYLQLPSNITQETYNLVYGLIKGCNSNSEKIDKISKYLLENYKYSLTVTSVPKDKEFLDYFLFQEKKGYCTYFATASTIFARIAGIPARYVEGFSMDDTKDSSGFYLVGNNRAHAWTEILISPSKNSWKTLDCTPSFSEDKQRHEIIMPNTNSKGVKSRDTQTNKNINVKKIPKIKISYVVILWCIGLGLFLFVLGGVSIRVKRWIKNNNKIFTSNGVIPIYYFSKKRLSTIGIKWSASISDEEGAFAIEDKILREHFANIVKVFYEEYYGGIIDNRFNKIEFYKYLESYIKKNTGFFKYYYNKLF